MRGVEQNLAGILAYVTVCFRTVSWTKYNEIFL